MSGAVAELDAADGLPAPGGPPCAESPAAADARHAAEAARAAESFHTSGADTLAASVVLLLSITVVQRIVGFVRGVLFCRWLTPDELGQWDLAYSFLTLVAPLVVLGLPGSYGRYVEYFRQRGRLGTMLRQSAAACVALTALAVAGGLWAAPDVAEFWFGSPARGELAAVMIVSTAAVVFHNYMVSLLTALRRYRVVSRMQFAQSLLFAALGVALLWGWRMSAESVVLAFGLTMGLTAACAVGAARAAARALPDVAPPSAAPPPRFARDIWSRLLPFALWVWVTNWLFNVFEVIDRAMIVHTSGLSEAAALELVGQYHSARLVPLLFIGVAELLAAVILPHLSHDWELGRRRRVDDRLHLTLKLGSFGLCLAGAGVLLVAPLLFGAAWGGKFAAGLEVLPWTLAICAWSGLFAVAFNYLFCVEQARLGSLPLVVALGVSVGLNAWLLPWLGLLGVVLATAVARLVALGLLCALNHHLGLRHDGGTLALLALPAAFVLGPWGMLAVLALVGVAAWRSDWMVTPDERTLIRDAATAALDRLRRGLGRPAASHT